MQLTGHVDPDTVRLLNELMTACKRMESQMRELPDDLTRKCLVRLYNDLSAVTAGIVNYLCVERASSQVTAALLRTLMESCISVFAFCKAPGKMGPLYWHYDAVLDWKFVLMDEKNVGCPYVPEKEDYTKRFRARKIEARKAIGRLGEPYVKPKKKSTPGETLKRALTEGSESSSCFRDTWYGEGRKAILESEGMGWTYDVLYTRLCSCVHSDSAASKVLGGLSKDHAVNTAMEWFGAAIFKILETFPIRVSAEHKRVFRFDYESLQYPSRQPK